MDRDGRPDDLDRGGRGIGRPARRQADAGAQGAARRGALALRRRRRPRDGSRKACASLFPLEDIAVMGFSAVIERLPTILHRIRQTVEAVVAAKPDILVIIDSPDFTHRVAQGRAQARARKFPSSITSAPRVWAWRPGRAPKMRAYVDHLLALLPFEPDAHRAPRRAANHLCGSSADRAPRRDPAGLRRARSGAR